MTILTALLDEGGPIPAHRPFPRALVREATWQRAIGHLASGELTLLSVWGDVGHVHMALLEDEDHRIAVLTLPCPDGTYPAIGQTHPPAIRLERAIRDLFGYDPVGLPDPRGWLDHRDGTAYAFLPVEGEGLHQIPVGPVHAGIIEPGHFRFTCDGETVVRLEQRLGYVHKGVDELFSGAPLDRAARLACRVSGDSAAALGLGFARAVEAALGVVPPPRAVWLRALMAEMERVANHLGDFGAICNDASFTIIMAHCAVLRERMLRAAHDAFGHRLIMDRIVPGGVTMDLDEANRTAIAALADDVRKKFTALTLLYDRTASLQDRTVTTGILKPELARQFGAGGYVGRASGRAFDSRKHPGYAPYDSLSFEVPVLTEGDVNARVWIRVREIGQSLNLIEQILRDMPEGDIQTVVPAGSGEGMSLTETFRGDVLVWLRLNGGVVDRCHVRDASWFQWPLLEAVIEGNIVADFPLCNKSFNCSYSGHDL
ncbi:MAG: hydrogenase expression protein HypE [Acetobacteraceae bacterium]|nr:hydrogenase expression protein HypE [Acetobacteraceae bacterium]